MERALEILAANPPHVFNHYVETVPDLYRNVRPGADYQWSITLLQKFKARPPHLPTKSGLILALGATMAHVQAPLRHLRDPAAAMVTNRPHLHPSSHHPPVLGHWPQTAIKPLSATGTSLGFTPI